jgi:hypothetical protein
LKIFKQGQEMNFKDKLQEAYRQGYQNALSEQEQLPSMTPALIRKTIKDITGQGPKKIAKRFLKGKGLPIGMRPKFTKQQKKELSDLLKIIFPDSALPDVPGPFISVIRGIMLKLLTGQPLTFLENQILIFLNIDLKGLIPVVEDALNDLFDDLPDDP